jgi:hypothetical protein
VDVDDTLSILMGEWQLERVIEDHLKATCGRFEGTATVASADANDVATYDECGRVSFGAHEGPSHRALIFTRRPEGGVAVTFADGKPFFELDLRAGHCEALHPCRADTYELAFELRSRDHLTERWRVRGPEKDYDAVTTWRRSRS